MEYRVLHTSFTVADLERSIAFYRDILGFKLETVVDGGEVAARVVGLPGAKLRLAFLRNAGHQVELVQYMTHGGKRTPQQRNDVGGAHVAFHVDDCEAAYRELKAKGVRFISTPQDAGTAKACYFQDPDGITLELIERRTPRL